MKESKIASFSNVSFGADFDSGKLVSLTVIPDRSEGGLVLSAAESEELYAWLKTAVLKNRFVVGHEAPGAGEAFPAIRDSAFAQEAVINSGKITDAQSVARRKPLAEQLASEGMVLEDRPVNIPVQVPGGKR